MPKPRKLTIEIVYRGSSDPPTPEEVARHAAAFIQGWGGPEKVLRMVLERIDRASLAMPRARRREGRSHERGGY